MTDPRPKTSDQNAIPGAGGVDVKFDWFTPFRGQGVLSIPSNPWNDELFTIFQDIDHFFYELETGGIFNIQEFESPEVYGGSGPIVHVDATASPTYKIGHRAWAGGVDPAPCGYAVGGGNAVTSLAGLTGDIGVLSSDGSITITVVGNDLNIKAGTSALTDEKVKMSAADPTAGYMQSKIFTGTNDGILAAIISNQLKLSLAANGHGNERHNPDFLDVTAHNLLDHTTAMSTVALADLSSRSHSELQNILGSGAEHLSNAERIGLTTGVNADAFHIHASTGLPLADYALLADVTAYTPSLVGLDHPTWVDWHVADKINIVDGSDDTWLQANYNVGGGTGSQGNEGALLAQPSGKFWFEIDLGATINNLKKIRLRAGNFMSISNLVSYFQLKLYGKAEGDASFSLVYPTAVDTTHLTSYGASGYVETEILLTSGFSKTSLRWFRAEIVGVRLGDWNFDVGNGFFSILMRAVELWFKP